MSIELPTRSYPPLVRGYDLFQRAESSSSSSDSATATDSNGCVICNDSPTCPTCPSGQQCVMTVQSCTQCSKTHCKDAAITSPSSGRNIGGIVGGTVGGVCALAILLFLFYKYYYQRKVVFNRVREHKEFFFDDDAEINFHHNRVAENLNKPSQRASLATTVFTRASNIIPIAYIPGVTIGAQGTNSSMRMSTVSESGTFSSEFIGDRYSKASIVGNPALTTTAIRAKPKLVTVSDAKYGNTIDGQDNIPSTAVGSQKLGGVRNVHLGRRNHTALATDFIEEEDEDYDEDEEEEDTQSVVMKNETDTVLTAKSDYEPFIIDEGGDEDDEAYQEDANSMRSRESNGSVLLEVEIDQKSPFDDSFGHY